MVSESMVRAHISKEDTKKSFDFTGEIKKLNASGASDRASFVEQLKMTFKTPAKINLCDFGTNLRVKVTLFCYNCQL
jgi:hypothetical protein